MFKLILYFTAVLLVTIVWGIPPPAHQENAKDGDCIFHGRHIKEGVTAPAPIGFCQNVTCVNAERNTVSTKNCEEFVEHPSDHVNCSIYQEEDLTKPFPMCCVGILCDIYHTY